jgi:hypothetical protein
MREFNAFTEDVAYAQKRLYVGSPAHARSKGADPPIPGNNE